MPRSAKRKTTPTRAAVPGANLTDFQQLVCNLAADLILNGGRKTDAEYLVKATLGHSLYQRFKHNDAWLDSDEKKSLDCHVPAWLRRLSCHWPEKVTVPEPEPTEPTTVSQMARANLRSNLRRHFEAFLGDARMHELYLLDNVLMNVESANGGSDDEAAESTLAEAFMFELGSDHTYVKVVRDQVEAVEEYIEGLSVVPDKEHEMAELTRMWRKDHPEPLKGSSARPKGRTQHEMDPDSD